MTTSTADISIGEGATLDGTTFLRWALPRLGLDWRGYRKVRGQVLKRVRRRVDGLGLDDLRAYRERLLADPAEWRALDALTDVSISRFHRDARVFEGLTSAVLPDLRARARASGRDRVRVWCAGVASGEEPYTLAIADAFTAHEGPPLEILATDRNAELLSRARKACYPRSSLRELPEAWRDRAFVPHGRDELELRPALRERVTFRRQDMRREAPDGPYDLVLCRNSAFMYLDAEGRRGVLARICDRLREGGVLVVGSHDRIPPDPAELEPLSDPPHAFRRASLRRSARSA